MKTRFPQRAAGAAPPPAGDSARQQPRTLAEIIADVRVVPCGQCWAQPPSPCTVTGAPGFHLARFGRAHRRGLLSDADLAAVMAAAGETASNATIIRDTR